MEVIILIVLLGFATLVTAIAVSIYYRRKYGPISRQLSELLSDQAADEATDQATVEAKTTAVKAPIQKGKVVEHGDKELFKKLTTAIRKEHLYTMPKFGRKELVERFHLSSKRVSSAFSLAGTSVPEFIRECRLEHARQLIVERPDMTLVEIATASGFVHASTFTVDFKNKYGVSPTQYREEKKSEK